ncbi:MAG: glycosyltransferase family 4 protein, partial [Candidatus Margulisiibacteriota bacterium]
AAARAAIRKKYDIGPDEKVALCVGQIQPRKGVEDFLKTAENLPDVKFVWVGGRPYGRLTEEYDKMTKLVDNAPKNVIFAGIIKFEDMPLYYAAADIYFMPSYQENFAFATIEAASVKLPLVTRDNSEYPGTLFEHYLKAHDAEGFTSEIKKLSTDQAFYKEYCQHSDTLANMYEINTYTEKLVAIYRSVANSK